MPAHRLVIPASAAALALLSLIIYLQGFRYYTVGDALPAELMPISVLHEGNFDFNEFPGNSGNLPYYFVRVNVRVISFYPIVPGLLNVPVYWVADKLGMNLASERGTLSFYTASGICALSVAAMFLALSQVAKRLWIAALFALIYAFGTEIWPVASRLLWQHGPSLLFLSAALACILAKDRRWTPLSGFFLGMAVWTRPANIVFAAPIALYLLLHERRRIWAFLALAAIPALLMAWYSHAYWGTITALGQGHRPGAQHGIHHTGFQTPLLTGLSGVLLSPARGLFIFTPVFLFSFGFLLWVFIAPLRRLLAVGWAYSPTASTSPPTTPNQRVYPYLAIAALADIILFARWNVWWGGHSFGYRMLIETAPILIIFLMEAWQRLLHKHLPLNLLFCLLVLTSVYIQFLGALYYPGGFNTSPTDIDTDRPRLWQIRDTELIRLHRKFIADCGSDNTHLER
jgi:hypothetical protein